jgi:methionyl-tRNA formyltransferase
MKKIAYLYYRSWSYEILKFLTKAQAQRGDFEISDVIVPKNLSDDWSFLNQTTSVHKIDPNNKNELINILSGSDIELVFCFSWSWILSDEIVENYHCICLHPSKLPKYRGGSPIQNQVFDGILESAVSVFKMNSGVDSGPIYKQKKLNLDSPIEEIFRKMSDIGKNISNDLISDYLNNTLVFYEQNDHNSTIFKRRKPSDSFMSFKEIANINFDDFQRKVNILRKPYPNLYVNFSNYFLEISQIHFFNFLPPGSLVLNKKTLVEEIKNIDLYLQIHDGFALLSEYGIKKNKF